MKTEKTSFLLVVAAAALMIVAMSCSDLKKNLPTAVNLQKTVHSAGWMDTSSAEFHGRVLLQQLVVDTTATAQCGKCHGVTVTKTCADCHGTGYPHTTTWKVGVADTVNFHGAYLKKNGYVLTECVACHGSDYAGGSSGKTCYRCHTNFPHTTAWTTESSGQFHGKYLEAKGWNATECQTCHGANYAAAGKSCYTCHAFPHTSAWTTVASGQSHGQYLKNKSWNATECQACHGATYTGGTSGQACFTCHSTYPHVASMETAHPGILQTNGYPLGQCQTCHGVSYTGGTIANISCETAGCHRDGTNTPKSPEACNSCHGQFRAAAGSALTYAPPKGVIGDSLTTVAAVGAHQKHLVTNTVGATVACAECHTVPASTFASGHLNPSGQAIRAEVLFTGALAKHATAVTPNPSYDLGTNRCSSTYCHGNWRLRKSEAGDQSIYTDTVMVGANFSPKWNGTSAEAACGTCHGLPPTGHDDWGGSMTQNDCFNCHGSVINDQGVIINKTLHVNGQVNL